MKLFYRRTSNIDRAPRYRCIEIVSRKELLYELECYAEMNWARKVNAAYTECPPSCIKKLFPTIPLDDWEGGQSRYLGSPELLVD